MGIWRVQKGTIHCDNCEKLIATLEFDAGDLPNFDRVHIWCLDCRKPKPHTPTEDKEE